MEMDESCTWQARAAEAPSTGSASRKSLNEDPYNLRAEELAIEHCKQGVAVCKEWSEGQMVTNFSGGEVPGTPDGMFEDTQGLITCVQVVRVPLLPAMDADEVADTLYNTVLTKVVKSQTWIKSTAIVPYDFVIFCWLPPVGSFKACMEPSEGMLWVEALMWNVRSGGWPFSLMVMVPDEPEALFPSHFGKRHEGRVMKDFWSQLSFVFNPADVEIDDEPMEWDLFACEEELDGVNTTQQEEIRNDEVSKMNLLIAFLISYFEGQNDVAVPPWRALAVSLGIECGEGECEASRRPVAANLPWPAGAFYRPEEVGLEAKGARRRSPIQGLPWKGEGTIFADDDCDGLSRVPSLRTVLSPPGARATPTAAAWQAPKTTPKAYQRSWWPLFTMGQLLSSVMA